MQSMKTSRLLCVVVVLQGLILLGQWTGNGPVTPAFGQIPDAGNQRQAMVDELKAVNTKLDRIAGLLESGKIQVMVQMPDEKKEK
jgi:hypothetical protein